jgi:hypothetical protein
MEITRRFKTLHELGDFLVKLGNELKQMTDRSLVEESKDLKQSDNTKGKKQKIRKKTLDKSKIDDLVAILPQMGRDEAEKSLSELTYEELKVIAGKYKISGRQRKSKKGLIEKILYNLYDFKTGHELLRNFSSER